MLLFINLNVGITYIYLRISIDHYLISRINGILLLSGFDGDSSKLLTNHNVQWYSLPDETSSTEDRSSPVSSDEIDTSLFLLKKDSKRRSILYKILNADQDRVVSNLRESLQQVSYICSILRISSLVMWHNLTTSNGAASELEWSHMRSSPRLDFVWSPCIHVSLSWVVLVIPMFQRRPGRWISWLTVICPSSGQVVGELEWSWWICGRNG